MLTGWKAIAAYLHREERTAMRWAKERGLPVHRAPGPGRGSIYALREEIDAWLLSARAQIELAVAEPPIVEEWTTMTHDAVAPVVSAAAPSPRRRWPAAASLVAVLALVAAAMALHRPAPHARAEPYRFADAGARAAYLQATFDWNLRTRASLSRAVGEYGAAIERDPRAAPAYVGLANTYLLLREDGAMPDEQAYPRAEAAARAAAALAPDSAATRRTLAFIAFWWQHDRDAAREAFARAISLDPASALTHHWFATALSANGENKAALREILRARELDPTDSSIVADHGLIAYLAGRRAEAVATLRALEREQPQAVSPHRYLADIALWEGNGAWFVHEASATARLRGDARQADALDGMPATDTATVTLALLRQARAEVARTGGGWFQLARAASLAGRKGEAVTALARACRSGDAAVVAAAGDLWLSRTLDAARIGALCGRGASLGRVSLL